MANILTSLKTNIDRIADAVEGGVTPTPTPTPTRTLVIPEQTGTAVIDDPNDLAHVMLSDSSIPENYTGPLIVMFDGNQYEVSYNSDNHGWEYPTGASHIEFIIAPGLQYPDLILFTPEEGTHTISAYIEESDEEQTGDFTSAKITLIDPSSRGLMMYGAFYNDGGTFTTAYTDAEEANIILYAGRATITIPNNADKVTASGNATFVEGTVFSITGDCTLTVSRTELSPQLV